jgi:hypothetical protein
MIRSFLSFCLSLFKLASQVRLENIFLRKQVEILARTSTRPRLRRSDWVFFSVITGVFSCWKETLLGFRPETVIRWHRQGFRLFWKWKNRSEAGRPKIPRPKLTWSDRWQTTTLYGAPREFTARCSNWALISQKPLYSVICSRDLKRQPGNAENVLEKPLRRNHLPRLLRCTHRHLQVAPCASVPLPRQKKDHPFQRDRSPDC